MELTRARGKGAGRLKQKLRFGRDGTFKLMMFSDFQDTLPIDGRSLRLLRALLESEKPDFVLSAGDQCAGGVRSEEEFRAYARAFSEPMEEAGIYWSHVFGNHDDENSPACDKFRQQAIYEELPHCLSEAGPEGIGGVGNYVLPVYPRKGETPALNLWALDSNRYLADNAWSDGSWCLPETGIGGNGYDVVKFPQIRFYWDTSVALERAAGHAVPGLMFLHIPLPEHRLVAQNPEQTGMSGEANEEICNSALNGGLFAAAVQRGDICGIFAGHDHSNTFAGRYCGVALGYDGSLGYRDYGLAPADPRGRDALRGARFFVLEERAPRNFTTYMRFAAEFGL